MSERKQLSETGAPPGRVRACRWRSTWGEPLPVFLVRACEPHRARDLRGLCMTARRLGIACTTGLRRVRS